MVNPKIRRAGRIAIVPTVGAVLALAAVAPANASSHREAPLISQDPVADNTDVYAFVSPDKPGHVNLIADFIPFEDPAGGPNFYRFGDDVLYRINIDNNGDAVPDITYDFRFQTQIMNPNTFLYATGPITSLNDPNYNLRQTYSMTRSEHGAMQWTVSGLPVPPNNVGPVSTPNYDQLAQSAVRLSKYGVRSFAGQRDDPFFVDVGSIFDLGQLRPFKQAYAPAPSSQPVRGKDGLGGYNVNSIAIQVPMSAVTKDGQMVSGPKASNAVIGVWSTTYRRQTRVLSTTGGAPMNSGNWVQVSRLGSPLINEVVIPLKDKDVWNSSQPSDDGQFAEYVLDPELGHLISALYSGVKTPPAPRNDLVAIFLTGISGLTMPPNVTPAEELRLNLGVPATPTAKASPLGVLGGDLAGFPNGRRLADDVTDIELRAVAGGTPFTPKYNVSPNNDLGDGVNYNDKQFMSHFPYVATPWQGYQDTHGTPGSTMTIPIKP